MLSKSGVLEQNAPNANLVMEGGSFYNRCSKPMDVALKLLINGVALLYVVVLISALDYILVDGLGYASQQSLSTSCSETKASLKGILSMIINTLYIIVITLLIATPIDIYSAIYLTQYTKQDKLVKAIHFTTEVLSGAPSVLFGLFGYTVSCILLRLQILTLAGCLTMVLCILPMIVRATEESLISVLSSYEEGAFAFSAGKLCVVLGIVLPYVMPNVLTVVILAMGRIVGKSAALLFTPGLAYQMPKGFFQQTFSSGHALTLYLYRTTRKAITLDTMNIAFAIVLVLLILVFLLNRLAGLLSKTLQRGTEQFITANMAIGISIQNLGLFYNDFQALHRVSLEIPEDQITAFIGPSGRGRSTCLKTLNRMNDIITGCHIEGKVSTGGEDICDPRTDANLLRRCAGMASQKSNPFPMSVYDNIAYGPCVHGVKNRDQLDQIVKKSFRSAALWDEVKNRPGKSVLGPPDDQQQHLCIARALAVDPGIPLMDKSISALDPVSTQKIENLFDEPHDRYTVIVATHNVQQAAHISNRMAFFLLGEVMEFTETRLVFEQPKDECIECYTTGRFG